VSPRRPLPALPLQDDLYRHFPSKTDLVLAFLQEREQRWTVGRVEAEARRRGSTPEGRLLATFDMFDEWFRRDDFEACAFINVLLEVGPEHTRARPPSPTSRTSAPSCDA
jgi:AcrR family transcriptional regulator